VDRSFIEPTFVCIAIGVVSKTLKNFTIYKDYEGIFSNHKLSISTHNLKLFKEVSYDEIIFLYDMCVSCKEVTDELDLILLNWRC
jgi:hypothetical protein